MKRNDKFRMMIDELTNKPVAISQPAIKSVNKLTTPFLSTLHIPLFHAAGVFSVLAPGCPSSAGAATSIGPGYGE